MQFILPDGKTVTIPTLYPQVLQKLIDGQRQGARITHADFPKLNISTFRAIISDLRRFLAPYGFKIEIFKTGELKQEGKYGYRLEKAKDASLPKEKSSSDGPHNPILLGARLSKEQLSFSKREESRGNLEEEITKSLSEILEERKRKKACFLIDVYGFIEPLLSQNNFTLALFVDRWFSKDEEDEEKAKVNREKVKEKILASFESGLINRYKIYGTLSWEEAKKEIASLKLEASSLLI